MSSQENKNLSTDHQIRKLDELIKIEQNKQYWIKIIWIPIFCPHYLHFYIIYLIFIGNKFNLC